MKLIVDYSFYMVYNKSTSFYMKFGNCSFQEYNGRYET